MCASWVRQSLTPEMKLRREGYCRQLLSGIEDNPEEFYARLVMGRRCGSITGTWSQSGTNAHNHNFFKPICVNITVLIHLLGRLWPHFLG